MKARKLGSQGLKVSEIGYGSMGISFAYGASNRQEGIDTIRKAYDLGVTFFDTAELYGWGENERVVGEAVKGFRDEVVLATKFGYMPDFTLNSRPDHIRAVVDRSLAALGVDHIDLLYQHRLDPKVPIEEVAGAIQGLVQAGKVKYFGLSEAGPETIRRAHSIHPVSVLQTEYSLFERGVETLFPVLRDLGIGFVAYSPLGRGFLTGAAKPASELDESDWRRTDPRWQPGNFEKNVEATRKLEQLARSKGATGAQLALAWILAQGDDIVPIPGTRNQNRLTENVQAASLALTGEDLSRIREILPHGAVGARYAEAFLPTWI